MDASTASRARAAARPGARRARRLAGGLLATGLLALIGLLFLFPFFYMLSASLKDVRELFTLKPSLLPERWLWENYAQLFARLSFARNLLNSLLLATLETLAILFTASLAAFAFAKYDFPARDKLFVVLLATMMLPHQITIVPLYLIMVKLGWLNTYYAVVVPGTVSAFGIFLLRQYTAAAMPDELVEAARMDGASFFLIYARVVLPLVVPGLTVLGLLTFMNSWNSYLWPLLVLDRPEMQTAPVALAQLVGTAQAEETLYGPLIAGTTLATLPLVVIFLTCQRFFVSGLMSGALKG
jgi:ABC-type glycerol-3-phosphate transport system permease component